MNDFVLYKTETWDFVSLPISKHVIGCRCECKIKADGSMERYGARLVSKSFVE